MRLDHIAYRVADRRKTVDFFMKAFNYSIQTEFDLDFDDGSKVKCYALVPPEKWCECPWTSVVEFGHVNDPRVASHNGSNSISRIDYHLAPEIFVSDGDPDSSVGKWVAKRDGIGGIHHLAYQVDSVQAKMDEWKKNGYAEFTTENPLTCPGLVQCFTKPSDLTGVIYEFIERGEHGFCKDNVKSLMESTKDLETLVRTDLVQ